MNELTNRLRLLYVRELRTFEREIALFPDDESMWKTTPGVTNSAANLGWHVCGNLQHFVGRNLGGTDYVRHRELEFTRRAGSRAELVRELRKTADVVEQVLPTLPDDSLGRPYVEAVAGITLETGLFLLHLGAHLAFHLGQAGYLRRILTGDTQTARTMAVSDLPSLPSA